MARVVDANLVIKWYVEEPDSGAARALFWETAEFAVPDLLFLETASILSKKVRSRELTYEEARRISALIVDGPFDVHSDRELTGEAMRIALEYQVTPYDASYVALAMKLKTDCATADRKLFEKLRNTALRDYVTLLAEVVH
jgi:predicted nucleic acid-binding protein